jgi:hypothetical protein
MAHPLRFMKKHARNNDSKDEKPPDRSPATSGGLRAALASRPNERSPLVLLKNARGNDTAVEGPPGQSLATRGGSGAVPAFRPSEWSKLGLEGSLHALQSNEKT